MQRVCVEAITGQMEILSWLDAPCVTLVVLHASGLRIQWSALHAQLLMRLLPTLWEATATVIQATRTEKAPPRTANSAQAAPTALEETLFPACLRNKQPLPA